VSVRVAVVMSGFPRRSETFGLNELRALHAEGMLAAIFATKPGDGLPPHAGTGPLLPLLQLLPPGSPAAQAQVVADSLAGTGVDAVHGYFAHEPAAVAEAAGALLALPHGFSVHARDARKVAPAVLARRVSAAACVIACNGDVAREVAAADGKLRVVPHGVDLERFRPATTNGRPEPRLLAVGRLVEKKGFDILIEATARLRVPFRLRIVGDGPERARLADLARRAGVADRVELAGSRPQEDLPTEYAAADIVVVPSVQDRDGDRDGLPNVLLEAMACGRPVIATSVGSIPDAIENARNGILVTPGDPKTLAAALNGLLRASELRRQLGTAARSRVEREFDLRRCTERLVRTLEEAYG
jgi:glycosyltransferase involved in cell wall biosynthesis